MKITCTGRIRSIRRLPAAEAGGDDGRCSVELDLGGSVDAPTAGAARQVAVLASFTVRAVVADQLRFGQALYVTIDTEERSVFSS